MTEVLPCVRAHELVFGYPGGPTVIDVPELRIDRGERDGVTTDERTELAALRREVATLRMERELLKRATAFWVKESGQ